MPPDRAPDDVEPGDLPGIVRPRETLRLVEGEQAVGVGREPEQEVLLLHPHDGGVGGERAAGAVLQ
ncbi:hypothetical protein FV223_24800, partial [Methylobacterium sp. WL116]